MSAELQLEWFAWLRSQPQVRLFVLVETHWSFTSEYSSSGWRIIHSAKEGSKGGGVMIGVREDMIQEHSLKWRVLIPGRLLHLRVQLQRQQMDIVGVYQTAVSHVSGEQQRELLGQRKKLWNNLDALLAGLPFRSSIAVLGDFNTTFSPLADVAGPGILSGSRAPWLVQERADVMQILRRHRLVVLNSWKRPQHTFHHPNGKSQIDYILVRKQLSDQTARQCSVISPPIAAWRSSGHRPLLASFRLDWQPWKQSIKPHRPIVERAPPLQQILESSAPQLHQLQLAVQQQLENPVVKPNYPAFPDVDSQVQAIWRTQ